MVTSCEHRLWFCTVQSVLVPWSAIWVRWGQHHSQTPDTYIHTWVQTIFISVNYFLRFWIWTKKLRVFVSQEQKMINSIVATFVLCMFLVWSETQGLQYLFHLPFEHQAGNVTSGRLLSKLNFKQVCWGSGNMSNISSFMNMLWKFNIILLKAW